MGYLLSSDHLQKIIEITKMAGTAKKVLRRNRIRRRLRTRIKGTAERPRLSIFRSNKQIYAQIIDDAQGRTVAAASTLGAKASGANVDAAQQVGKDIAAAAKKAGVTTVVLDRGVFLFHGRF